MKKLITLLHLLIALSFAIILKAEPVIKATLSKNTSCGPSVLAAAIVLEYAETSDEDFNIGSSSIFLNYNTSKLSFFEFVESSSFDEYCFDISETANSQNGFINFSIDDVSVNTEFSPEKNQHLVGYAFFNIIAEETINNEDIYFNEYYTSFNNKNENDGTNQIPIEFDNELALDSTVISCPSSCDGNDSFLVNNIDRGWNHVCTVNNGELTLDWPNSAYFNDLRISIDGGQTFSIPTEQNYFSANDLPIGDYDVKVKIGENGCVTTLEDINIKDLSHQVTRTWRHATCGENNGWIKLTWTKKILPSIDISIDAGKTYVTIDASKEQYVVQNLAPGNYSILVKWSYAPYACTTQLDDINIRVLNPNCRQGKEAYKIISLYPNPANDYINIALGNNEFKQLKIEIYNLTGRLLKEKNITPNESTFNLDVGQLISGIYLVKIITNEGEQLHFDKITIAH